MPPLRAASAAARHEMARSAAARHDARSGDRARAPRGRRRCSWSAVLSHTSQVARGVVPYVVDRRRRRTAAQPHALTCGEAPREPGARPRRPPERGRPPPRLRTRLEVTTSAPPGSSAERSGPTPRKARPPQTSARRCVEPSPAPPLKLSASSSTHGRGHRRDAGLEPVHVDLVGERRPLVAVVHRLRARRAGRRSAPRARAALTRTRARTRRASADSAARRIIWKTDAGVDAARAGRHHQSLQRGEPHGGIDRATEGHRGQRGSSPKMCGHQAKIRPGRPIKAPALRLAQGDSGPWNPNGARSTSSRQCRGTA